MTRNIPCPMPGTVKRPPVPRKHCIGAPNTAKTSLLPHPALCHLARAFGVPRLRGSWRPARPRCSHPPPTNTPPPEGGTPSGGRTRLSRRVMQKHGRQSPFFPNRPCAIWRERSEFRVYAVPGVQHAPTPTPSHFPRPSRLKAELRTLSSTAFFARHSQTWPTAFLLPHAAPVASRANVRNSAFTRFWLPCAHAKPGVSLASTHDQTTRGTAELTQGARPPVAFPSTSRQLRPPAVSHLRRLLRASSPHRSEPRPHGRLLPRPSRGPVPRRSPSVRLVCPAKPLPRPRKNTRCPEPPPKLGTIPWADLPPMERRGECARAQGVLSLRRTGHAIGPTLPDHLELNPSQPGSPRLHRTLDRLAMEQRGGVSGGDVTRRSQAYVAGASPEGLRQRLGRSGNVSDQQQEPRHRGTPSGGRARLSQRVIQKHARQSHFFPNRPCAIWRERSEYRVYAVPGVQHAPTPAPSPFPRPSRLKAELQTLGAPSPPNASLSKVRQNARQAHQLRFPALPGESARD